jgi:hypothetical protein
MRKPAAAVHLKILSDGTRIRFPRMGPARLRHPLFFCAPSPFHEGQFRRRRLGGDPASLNGGYGSKQRCVKKGDPFRKGTGLFLGRRPRRRSFMSMRPQRQRSPETRYVSALLRPAKIETMAFISTGILGEYRTGKGTKGLSGNYRIDF